MHISTPFFIVSSISFFGRFILALIILSFLYSKNKTDSYIKKGFIWLLVLAAIVLVIKIIVFFTMFVLSGVGILTSIFSNYHWYF